MATTQPIDFQAELDDIAQKRSMIQALRMREGAGEQYPGFAQLIGSVGRMTLGDPLDKLAKREKALASQFEAKRANATQGILEMADPDYSPTGPAMGPPTESGAMSQGSMTASERAARQSRAMSAGVPQALIDKAMASSQFSSLLKSMDNDPLPSQQVQPGQQAQPPQGGPSALPFVNGAPQGAAQGADPFARVNQRDPTDSPFSRLSDSKLLVLTAAAKGLPQEELLKAEAKNRELTIKDNTFMRGGKAVGFIKDGILTDATGQTIDLQGAAVAARAGLQKAAEAKAQAPYQPIQTTDDQGRARTTFAPQMAGYGQQGPDQGAPQAQPGLQQPGKRATLNLQNATQEEAMQAMQAAYGAPAASQSAPAPQGGQLGVGPDPIAQKAKEGAVATTVQANQKLNDDFVTNSYRPALQEGQQAKATLAQLQALDQNVTKTGWGTESMAAGANVLAGLGIAPDKAKELATSVQTFNAVAGEQAWQLLAAQKGMQTEGDAARAKQTLSQLGNTPEANKFIRDLARAVATQKVAKAEFFAKALPQAQQAGNLTALDAAWQEHAPSIFSFPFMAQYAPKGGSDIDALVQKYGKR